jgi:hypothetical protein
MLEFCLVYALMTKKPSFDPSRTGNKIDKLGRASDWPPATSALLKTNCLISIRGAKGKPV